MERFSPAVHRPIQRLVSDPVYLPTGLVALPSMLPRCCVRHGVPATVTKPLTFHSRPHPASYLLLLLGVGLIVVLLISLTRTRIAAPAWNFCDRCRAERSKAITTGWLIAVPGAVVGCVLGGMVSDTNEGLGALLFLLALVAAPLAGAIVGSRGSWLSLAGGEARRDGGSVVFKHPAPMFVASLPDRAPMQPVQSMQPVQPMAAGFGPAQGFGGPQQFAPPAASQQFGGQQFGGQQFPPPQQFPSDPRFPAPPE